MNFKEFNEMSMKDSAIGKAVKQEWRDCLDTLREQKVNNPIRLNAKGVIDSDYSVADASFVETMSKMNLLKEEEFSEWGDYKKTLKESGIRNNIDIDENGNILSEKVESTDFNIEDNFEEEKRLMEELVKDLKINKQSDVEDDSIESLLENSDFKVNNDETDNYYKKIQEDRDDFSLKETVHNIGKFANNNADDNDYTMYSEEAETEEKHFAEERSKSDTNSWNFIKSKFKNTRYV